MAHSGAIRKLPIGPRITFSKYQRGQRKLLSDQASVLTNGTEYRLADSCCWKKSVLFSVTFCALSVVIASCPCGKFVRRLNRTCLIPGSSCINSRIERTSTVRSNGRSCWTTRRNSAVVSNTPFLNNCEICPQRGNLTIRTSSRVARASESA